MNEAATSTAVRVENRWKPYPAYKDSGCEFLGEIPAHWNVSALRRKLNDGPDGIKIGPFGSQLKLDYLQDYGYKVYGQEHVIAGDFKLGSKYIGEEKFSELAPCSIKPGDLVVTMMGTSGRCQVVPSDIEPGIMDSHLLRLRVREAELTSTFASLLIDQAPYVREQLKVAGKGAIMHGLNSSLVKAILLGLPSVSEQQAIVEFLDHETAHLDALIAKKEQLIELLTEERSALISHAVTKGLDPTVAMKDSGVEWLGEIPAHWTPKKIKHLFRQTKRQNYADLTVLSVYRDYGVIEKDSRDDNHNRTPENLDTYQLVNVGDLVINKMKAWQGSLGMSEYYGITSPDYVVYAPEHNEDSRFLHYLLRAESMADVYRSISNGIRPSQWRLEPENFEKLVIFLPPLSEQAQICQFIDLEYKRIEHLITQVQKLISYLSEYRTALISATVTGKIDVREEVA